MGEYIKQVETKVKLCHTAHADTPHNIKAHFFCLFSVRVGFMLETGVVRDCLWVGRAPRLGAVWPAQTGFTLQ